MLLPGHQFRLHPLILFLRLPLMDPVDLEYPAFQFAPAAQKHRQNQLAQPVPRHPQGPLNQENQSLQAVQWVLIHLAIRLVQCLQ